MQALLCAVTTRRLRPPASTRGVCALPHCWPSQTRFPHPHQPKHSKCHDVREHPRRGVCTTPTAAPTAAAAHGHGATVAVRGTPGTATLGHMYGATVAVRGTTDMNTLIGIRGLATSHTRATRRTITTSASSSGSGGSGEGGQGVSMPQRLYVHGVHDSHQH